MIFIILVIAALLGVIYIWHFNNRNKRKFLKSKKKTERRRSYE